uniref:Lysine-specific demethylase 8 n=1 Tax=Lygus hesperus TaxID=30085 RepID=A0A0K8T326_LYGHE
MDIPTAIRELKKLQENSMILECIKSASPDVEYLLDTLREAVFWNKVSNPIETAVNAVIDISWEECNIGHWSSVPETPKTVYAYASFQKVIICLMKAANDVDNRSACLNEAIKAADLGLMLGKGYQRQLTQAASLVTSLISQEYNVTPAPNETSCSREPNESEMNENVFTEKSNAVPIGRLRCPSLEEFNTKHFSSRTPVILTGCINHWPAMTRWNDISYLLNMQVLEQCLLR